MGKKIPSHFAVTDLICAIVVTYRPDLALLRSCLAACRAQVDYLLVVDNGSTLAIQEKLNELVKSFDGELIQLHCNLGIAVAQNKGISRARDVGCSQVILVDQDSRPRDGMVSSLRSALAELSIQGAPIAAVGPRLLDRRTGLSTPFARIKMFGVLKEDYKSGGSRFLPTDFLASSGMVISMSTLDSVGLLEEALFIDNVDMEWCFRARSKGFHLYGVGDAVMEHSVGDKVVKIGGRHIYQHNPLRQYYIMRNRFVLYRRSYSPAAWVLQDFLRMLFKLIIFSVWFAPRGQNARMMLLGMWDGLRGKLGRLG